MFIPFYVFVRIDSGARGRAADTSSHPHCCTLRAQSEAADKQGFGEQLRTDLLVVAQLCSNSNGETPSTHTNTDSNTHLEADFPSALSHLDWGTPSVAAEPMSQIIMWQPPAGSVPQTAALSLFFLDAAREDVSWEPWWTCSSLEKCSRRHGDGSQEILPNVWSRSGLHSATGPTPESSTWNVIRKHPSLPRCPYRLNGCAHFVSWWNFNFTPKRAQNQRLPRYEMISSFF